MAHSKKANWSETDPLDTGFVDNKPTLGTAASHAASYFGTASDVAIAQADIDAHEADLNNPHSTTKTQIGLGNADNTSDTNKPVSTAQATSIATKLTTPTGTTSQYVRGDASLATFPIIPAAQIQSDMAQTNNANLDFVKSKNQFWKSGVRKYTVFEYTTSSTVSGGSVTFNVTDDGTAGGNALVTNWFKETANFWVEDNAATYQFGSFTVSANKKQITASITKLSASSTILSLISVLTGLTFVAPANGLTVYLTIKGE